MNSLIMKVKPTFTLNDLAVIPVGSHLLMLHVDSDTGQMRAIEGFEVTQEWIDNAMADHADEDRDTQFSSVLFEVNPVTDEEADHIATSIMAGHGFNTPQGLESINVRILRSLLVKAAKAGRGLDA